MRFLFAKRTAGYNFLKVIFISAMCLLFSSCNSETGNANSGSSGEKLPSAAVSDTDIKNDEHITETASSSADNTETVSEPSEPGSGAQGSGNDVKAVDPEIISLIESPRTSGTLTVSAQLSGYLQGAIDGFKVKYPDIEIAVHEYDPNTEGIDKDFMLKLQTEFLAGQGSDMLFGIGTARFAEKGLLADLTAFIENDPDINMDDYYSSVFNAFKTGVRQYMMPVLVTVDVLGLDLTEYSGDLKINDGETWSYTEIVELGKKIFDESSGYAMVEPLDNLLFYDMFQISNSQYIDEEKKEAYFDTGKFKDLLNYCKSLSANGYAAKAGSVEQSGKQVVAEWGINDNPFTRVDKASGNPIISYPRPLANETGDVEISWCFVNSINNNSSNKDLAWLFEKYLLSDEFLTSPAASVGDIPVKKSAVPVAVREHMNFGAQWMVDTAEIEYRTDDDTVNKYIGFIDDTLNMPLVFNPVSDIYLQAVIDGTDDFFKDKASAEETAASLQQKISMMLGE